MSEERKIFDDFPTTDCNDCEHWWTDRCDGAKTAHNASKMPCSAFSATRSVTIPQQIKWLKSCLKWLTIAVALLTAGQILLGVMLLGSL